MLFDEPIPLDDSDDPNAPIPLEDAPEHSAIIVPESKRATSVRCRRRDVRRSQGSAMLCFSHETGSGRVDNAECPVLNISKTGVAIVFDHDVCVGTSASIAYRSISGRPVHRGVTVRQCRPRDDGYFELGLQFDRPLQFDEARPARHGPGREVAPGIRARKLKPSSGD
ncbi:MAG: hypothetical protein HBSAPP02_09440 [Phycisphaerae bacterium]|nr:MAG: PilZ domain-containing protein [Planctomycetia bacterium]RIK69677.1 MAG: hypothetical protein DCC66_07910 [Planctomycetota bacterium]GJQ25912.1 MAG: hypothetical protein HBSAPP02_09440 [Phycisphaerae bacterium]